MTTAKEAYAAEARWSDKNPRKNEAWLHIKRWEVGHLAGWGEYSLRLPYYYTGTSLREWPDWGSLTDAAYGCLSRELGPNWQGGIVVRKYVVDEGL